MVTSVPEKGRYVTTKVQITDGSPALLQGSIRVNNKVALRGWRGSSVITLKDERGNIIFRKYAPKVAVNARFFSNHDRTVLFTYKIPDIVKDSVRSMTLDNINAGDRDTVKQIEENLKHVERLYKKASTIGK